MPAETLRNVYLKTRDQLRSSGVDNPDFVARDLIKRAVDVADIDIILVSEQEVYAGKVQEINECLKRHISGEPVSRIFGEREFWGLPFRVTPDVLDPRPDTETIVDVALKQFIGRPPERILDLGTGTGCLIVSLLTEWPLADGVATDVSEKALAVAKENAKKHNVDKRLKLLESDWFESVKGKFDVIVSNPPYISNQEIPNLPVAVKEYDPILALDGGNDGLDCYRKIISGLKTHLKDDGICFLEIGYSQAEDVTRLVEDSGLFVKEVHPDMAGIPRVVEISFGEK